MTIFDDIRRDHEAGTPGPWEVKYQGETHLYMNGDSQMCDMTYYPWVPDKTADWERIARVPELERIALAAEELAAAVDHERNMVCQDFGMQLQANNRVDAALAKLREATA